MMSIIEIYEALGERAGFSRNADQEPGGPFFRFACDAIEHISTNVPAEFAKREDLRSNAPNGKAITDLIRVAKKELKRLRNGPPKD
jgi:hypothetical protein